jgi:hypothetical protein
VSATNRRVLAELGRWASAYQRGEVPTRLARPQLSPGERLSVRIFPVRLSVEAADRPFEQWSPRPGARSLRPPFRNDGTLYATSDRLYTVRHPKRGVYEVAHERPWAEVASMQVVPNWRGVSLQLGDDHGNVVVVGNVFHTFLVRPSGPALAVGWLKVLGAWQESRGKLDPWLRAIQARLTEGDR